MMEGKKIYGSEVCKAVHGKTKATLAGTEIDFLPHCEDTMRVTILNTQKPSATR